MSVPVRQVSAIGAAASVFVGGMLGLPTPFLGDLAISIPAALITGAGILALWPSKQQVKRAEQLDTIIEQASKQAGIDPKEVVEAINTATTKLATVRKHAEGIRAPNTTRRINKICNIGDQIVEDFRIDPKDVRLARAWIGTYLDQTIDVVKGYAVLSRTGSRNIQAQEQMAKFESMLDVIEDKFDELLKSLLENDIAEFDINTSVLGDMIQQEGIRS